MAENDVAFGQIELDGDPAVYRGLAEDEVAIVEAGRVVGGVDTDCVRCDPAGQAHEEGTRALGAHAHVAMCIGRFNVNGFGFVVEVQIHVVARRGRVYGLPVDFTE